MLCMAYGTDRWVFGWRPLKKKKSHNSRKRKIPLQEKSFSQECFIFLPSQTSICTFEVWLENLWVGILSLPLYYFYYYYSYDTHFHNFHHKGLSNEKRRWIWYLLWLCTRTHTDLGICCVSARIRFSSFQCQLFNRWWRGVCVNDKSDDAGETKLSAWKQHALGRFKCDIPRIYWCDISWKSTDSLEFTNLHYTHCQGQHAIKINNDCGTYIIVLDSFFSSSRRNGTYSSNEWAHGMRRIVHGYIKCVCDIILWRNTVWDFHPS